MSIILCPNALCVIPRKINFGKNLALTSRLVIFNTYDDGHNLPTSEKIDGGNVRALICNQTILHNALRSDPARAPKRDQHVSQLSEPAHDEGVGQLCFEIGTLPLIAEFERKRDRSVLPFQKTFLEGNPVRSCRLRDHLCDQGCRINAAMKWQLDRKSTRLNSSHLGISYAV